jgi:vacuolar-type H+-ATPase subunit E/Vma4
MAVAISTNMEITKGVAIRDAVSEEENKVVKVLEDMDFQTVAAILEDAIAAVEEILDDDHIIIISREEAM